MFTLEIWPSDWSFMLNKQGPPLTPGIISMAGIISLEVIVGAVDDDDRRRHVGVAACAKKMVPARNTSSTFFSVIRWSTGRAWKG